MGVRDFFPWLGGTNNTLAETLVGQAHEKFMELGQLTYTWAVDNLNGLNNPFLTWSPYEPNVTFEYANPQASYLRPTRPDISTADLAFREPTYDPGQAPTYTPGVVTFDDAPELEDEPGYTTVLPDTTFNQNWSYTPQGYVGTLLDELIASLRPMIEGMNVIPAAIAQALLERSRSRIALESQASKDAVVSEWASRGFTLPPGQLVGAVLAIEQSALNAQADNAREVATTQFNASLEQQRFGVQQGVAVENALREAYTTNERNKLDAAKAQMDAAVAVFNARMDGFKTESQLERDRIQIVMDLNEKRVNIWSLIQNLKMERERLQQGVFGIQADAFRARLSLLGSYLDSERSRLAAVSTSVDAQSRLYSTDAQVESIASAAADRSFELGLRREESSVNVQLKVADQRIQQAQWLLAQIIEVQKAKAQISSQLAASTMSAVNYSAGVSKSQSRSESGSAGFSYSGEIDDA